MSHRLFALGGIIAMVAGCAAPVQSPGRAPDAGPQPVASDLPATKPAPRRDDAPAAAGNLEVMSEPVVRAEPAPEPSGAGGLGGLGPRGTAASGSGGSGMGTSRSAPREVGRGAAAPAPSRLTGEDAVRDDAERAHGDLRKEEGRKRSGEPRHTEARPSSSGTVYVPPTTMVAAPAMRAGRHDDNKQYNRFLQFLGDNSGMVAYPVNITERLVVRTLDQDGKSLHNCNVDVLDLKGNSIVSSTTFADGSTHFFPADAGPADARDYALKARCGSETRNGQLARTGRRVTDLRFGFARATPAKVPVDIAVVIDTTGSMQSQIDRLKKTLKAIHFQLTALSTQPDLRFGLVAYRDRGDDYVTQPYDFTRDVGAFQRVLDKLEADGGGDTPEDLQAALDDALHKLSWRDDALRLGFVVADAVPHTDYGQGFTYREAMRESHKRAIKWSMVGAGGLPREGEVIFRQVAQFSMGEYVFVTDSGAGEHEGGVGEASHHVGTNYVTENLDQAIIRIVRRELSYLTDAPKDFDDTIVATADQGVPRDEVLAPAVAEVLRQLADYSSLRLKAQTPVAVVPVAVNDGKHKDVAEYLTDKMILSASRNPALRVVERDLSVLAQEMKLQLSDLFDVTETVPIGKMVGAEVIIVAKLTVRKDGASLFAKLVRVETGEVLSVAQVDIGANVLHRS